IDFIGTDEANPLSPAEAAQVLASRPLHPAIAPHPKLPADTRLWAALQEASGGTWGGCVYDVDAIVETLRAGREALAQRRAATEGCSRAPARTDRAGRGRTSCHSLPGSCWMVTFLIIAAAIALQIFLTARKLSPFLSLLVVAIPLGLALGIAPQDLVKTIDTGVGSTLAGQALVIVLGAILGKVLEESGAAEKIVTTLIGAFGERNIQWALLLTGFLVGIPLYFNAGFIILVPPIFSLARRTGLPILLLAIPTVASLSTTHCFLPPHPGPVVLVNAFGADMGRTLLYGLVMAVPAVVIAGPWLSRRLKSINPPLPDLFNGPEDGARGELPGAACSFLIALSPVLLISVSVVADGVLPEGLVRTALLFLGNPTVALLLSTLLAFWFLGHRRGVGLEQQTRWLNAAIGGIAVILLIITAGGVFKQVL